MSEPRPPRYLKPMNKVMMAVQRLGIPTGPAMVLTVPGRKSGRLRSTPMTPFEFRGGVYVVAHSAIPAVIRTGCVLGADGNAVHRQRRQRPQSPRDRLHAVRGACTLAG